MREAWLSALEKFVDGLYVFPSDDPTKKSLCLW